MMPQRARPTRAERCAAWLTRGPRSSGRQVRAGPESAPAGRSGRAPEQVVRIADTVRPRRLRTPGPDEDRLGRGSATGAASRTAGRSRSSRRHRRRSSGRRASRARRARRARRTRDACCAPRATPRSDRTSLRETSRRGRRLGARDRRAPPACDRITGVVHRYHPASLIDSVSPPKRSRSRVVPEKDLKSFGFGRMSWACLASKASLTSAGS